MKGPVITMSGDAADKSRGLLLVGLPLDRPDRATLLRCLRPLVAESLTAVLYASAILAVLGYFVPEGLDRYEQHKARQAAEMAAEMQVKEWNQHFEERLLQRLEELKNDGRQSEEAIERWKYEHHLPSSRAEIRPIPPTHPPDDRPIDI